MVLDEVYRFACEVTGPLNTIGDQGCRLENGRVITPPGFKDAWSEALRGRLGDAPVARRARRPGRAALALGARAGDALGLEPGVQHVPGPRARRGRGHRGVRHASVSRSSTCRACSTARGAARCASPSRRRARTSAPRDDRRAAIADGTLRIKGTKIFISGGDHDLADNIVHLVLARIDGAGPGTKGLSLFIVPRIRTSEDGTPRPVQRRPRAVHRAQDGHQRLGDLRRELRRRRISASASSSAASRTRA